MPVRMPSIVIETVPFTKQLRGDVLIVPTPVARGRPLIRAIRGLGPDPLEQVRHVRAAWRSASEAGAIEAQLSPAGGRFDRVALVSLGRDSRVSHESLRNASACAARWCAQHRLGHAVVAMDPLLRHAGEQGPALWAEAAMLAGFRYDKLRSVPRSAERPEKRLVRLTFAAAGRTDAAAARRIAKAVAVAEAVNLARWYGHEPPNVINPVSLAAAIREEARRHRLRCQVLDARQLARSRMNGLLAVGRGSAHPPRLIILEHPGAARRSDPVVLIGKAVTQDTGGYSIKPHDSIPDMKYDKCGGMAVLGAMVAVARLKLPLRVVGMVVAAENMISADAFRPGDILTMASGKTVEVISTDAEGRLMLADALHFAQVTYNPRAIVDLATLTGACNIALGHHAAGLFANDDALATALTAAGETSGDRLWRMPLWLAYRKQIEGTDSDIKNTGGRPGGAITAAMFLKEFVSDGVPWAHLDIAGTAHTDKDSPVCPKGATGFGVRLLIDFLRHMSA